MTPSKEAVRRLRDSLQALDDRGGLEVLGAVSGVSAKRLRSVVKGDDPTYFEYAVLESLRVS